MPSWNRINQIGGEYSGWLVFFALASLLWIALSSSIANFLFPNSRDGVNAFVLFAAALNLIVGWQLCKFLVRAVNATEEQRIAVVSGALWPVPLVIGVALTAYGFGLSAYQVIFWMKSGEWVDCSLYSIWSSEYGNLYGPRTWMPSIESNGLSDNPPWIIAPSDWIGLHSIVAPLFRNLGLSVTALLGAGLFLRLAIDGFSSREVALREIDRGLQCEAGE